ncbi:MAG: non-canonical purine NTP pyrophosphatase [bacterium]|nr:non-canonical purine NTP pyrophosphatase [bacterium]
MKEITLVTSNPRKLEEIGSALAEYNIKLVSRSFDIPEIQADSLEEVIKDKIEQAYKIVKKPVIVDDAGIFFKGYKHFPGVYSRFMFASLGFSGLLKLIKNNQSAFFASYIAYKKSARSEPMLFSGKVTGKLTNRVRGKIKYKMPYDNIFIPAGDTRTFAEMTIAEKQQYDHRSKAVRKFCKYLSQQI